MTAADLVPITSNGPVAGGRNVWRHESRLWWRSRRWWIQLLVWTGLVNALFRGFLWVSRQAESGPIQLEEPASGVAQVFPQFVGFIVLLSTVGVVVLTQGAMLDERRGGTLEWILSMPVTRPAVVWGKYLAHRLAVLAVFVVVPWSGVYLQLSRELGTWWPAGSFALTAGLVALTLSFTIALVLLLGTISSSRAVVVGVPIAAHILYDAVHVAFPGAAGLIPLPWELSTLLIEAAAGIPLTSIVPVVATLALIPGCLWFATWVFSRREIF